MREKFSFLSKCVKLVRELVKVAVLVVAANRMRGHFAAATQLSALVCKTGENVRAINTRRRTVLQTYFTFRVEKLEFTELIF